MSLQTNIQDLATRIATEFKTIRTLIGGSGTADVSALNTLANDIVAAINEVKATADAAAGGGAGDMLSANNLSDVANVVTARTNLGVYSTGETDSAITTAVNNLLDGAPAALDTLNELAAAINDDAAFSASVTTALANRVRTDTAAQGLTGTQQANARTNIGAVASADIGNPNTNFVTGFEAGLT